MRPAVVARHDDHRVEHRVRDVVVPLQIDPRGGDAHLLRQAPDDGRPQRRRKQKRLDPSERFFDLRGGVSRRVRGAAGKTRADALDHASVPRVQQRVRFVQHEEAHVTQIEHAALDEVQDAAGRAHGDVAPGAARQRLRLRLLRVPAAAAAHEQRRGDGRTHQVLRERVEERVRLLRELARRLDDQRAGRPRRRGGDNRRRGVPIVVVVVVVVAGDPLPDGGFRDRRVPARGRVRECVASFVAEPQNALRVLEAHRREQRGRSDPARGSRVSSPFLVAFFQIQRESDAVAAVDGFAVLEKRDAPFVAVQRTSHDVAFGVRHAAVRAERLEHTAVRFLPRAAVPPRNRIRPQRVESRGIARAPPDAHQAVVRHLHLVVVLAGGHADGGPAPRPRSRVPCLRAEPVRGHRERVGPIRRAHRDVRGGGGRGPPVPGNLVPRGSRAPRRDARDRRVPQALVHDLQHGHAERARLAAARLRGDEHVAAAQDQRRRLRLHGGGQEPARVVRGADELGAHPELLERGHREVRPVTSTR